MLAEFQAGEKIVSEGDSANRFYLILESLWNWNRAARKVKSSASKPSALATCPAGPGFSPYCWHFDTRATTPSKTIFFYGTRLRELCETNHDLGYELMLRVSEIIIKRLLATRRELVKHKRMVSTLVSRT
jgi:CRP/FNR family cyclic AMP-dependent transcriptional regulator